MTNDLTTLNGSLQEVIDRLESNLADKGVTATFDSTKGILGLVDEIQNIETGGTGVPCYNVSFTNNSLSYSDWSFVTNGHIAYLEVYLQFQYQPYANGVVTLSDGTNTYTATTNANGIAVFTPTVTENTTTFTATYTNTSDTFTVAKSTFLWTDKCDSATNLTGYGSSVPVYTSTSGNPSSSLSYSATKNAYDLHSTNTGTSYFSMIPITSLNGKTNYVAEAMFQQSKSYSSNEVGLFIRNSSDTTVYGIGVLFVVYYNRFYVRRLNATQSSTSKNQTLDNITLAINTWYKLRMTVTDTVMKFELLKEDGSLIYEYSYNQALANKQFGLIQKGGTVANTTNYVKNIKVRSIA